MFLIDLLLEMGVHLRLEIPQKVWTFAHLLLPDQVREGGEKSVVVELYSPSSQA